MSTANAMNMASNIEFRHSNGNVHIGLHGDFDDSMAENLLQVMKNVYRGSGRIFIDTAKIHRVAESGVEYFKRMFSCVDVPSSEVFFKGETGRQLGVNGSKLIILKQRDKGEKKKCCGNCADCKCKK